MDCESDTERESELKSESDVKQHKKVPKQSQVLAVKENVNGGKWIPNPKVKRKFRTSRREFLRLRMQKIYFH